MPKRGETARESVKNTIINAFSATNDFVTFQDKKIYVQAKDGVNGEVIQFAVTLTMPKTPVAASSPSSSSDAQPTAVAAAPTVDLSAADKAKVEELKRKLGLI